MQNWGFSHSDDFCHSKWPRKSSWKKKILFFESAQFLPKAKTIMIIIVLIQGSQSGSVIFIARIPHSLRTLPDFISLENNMQLNAYVFNGFMRQNMLKCLASPCLLILFI